MIYEKEKEIFALFSVLTKQQKLEKFGFCTQRDFCAHYKIPHEKYLSEWKREKKFKKIQKTYFMDKVNDILPAALETLKVRGVDDGDVGALKEIMKIAGVSIERVEQVSSEDIDDLIDAVKSTVIDVLGFDAELQKKFMETLKEKLGEE